MILIPVLIAAVGVLVMTAELAERRSQLRLVADGLAGMLGVFTLLVIFNAIVSWAVSRMF